MKSRNRLSIALFLTLACILVNNAGAATTEYVCAARIDCGSPKMPSTQDIPSNETPMVRSDSAETAQTQCMARYTRSYLRLAKSLSLPGSIFKETKACQILSEALPAEN